MEETNRQSGHGTRKLNTGDAGSAPATALLASILTAAALALIFFAIRRAGVESDALILTEASIIIIAISYVSHSFGFRPGLLCALVSSLYFFSVESSHTEDELSSDVVFSIIAASSALLFGSRKNGVREAAAAEPSDAIAATPRLGADTPFEPQRAIPEPPREFLASPPVPLPQEPSASAQAAPPGPLRDVSDKSDFMELTRSELSPHFAKLERYIVTLKDLVPKSGDEKLVQLAAKIESQFRKLDRTLQKLFQFARIDFEAMPMKIDRFDAEKLFTETIDGMQGLSQKHQIVLVHDVRSYALGDRFKARKVLEQLLRNAMKYSPNGGKIVVGLSEEEGRIAAYVRDYGVGMDDAKLEEISKALSAPAREPANRSSLGIGLYTSNEIIRRLGGEMWVNGKKGKGTAFYFTLPKSAEQGT